MHVCLISPYHGGSHRAWAEGYAAHSKHRVELLTLPAHFWKWRMQHSAVTLARRFLAEREAGAPQPDVILATDMLDLPGFLALTRRHTARVPAVLFMHENQLTYPLPHDPTTGPMRRQMGERDRHYALINYRSMLAADRVFFNSAYHRRAFFEELPRLLRHFPDFNELDLIEQLQERSYLLPVGVNLRPLVTAFATGAGKDSSRPPLIIWNQRWEYDKNPEAFLAVLYRVADEGVPFRLALCGERFGRETPAFEQALARLSDRIIHAGYADEQRYRQLLHESAVTISTARHEYFGISIVEAIAAGAFPLLPNRLSYPELIPEAFHGACLYRTREELAQKLRQTLLEPDATRSVMRDLVAAVERFNWSAVAPQYDEALEQVAGSEVTSVI